jgi:hypothetical protein
MPIALSDLMPINKDRVSGGSDSSNRVLVRSNLVHHADKGESPHR